MVGVVGFATAHLTKEQRTPLDEARAVVDDEDRFAAARTSGLALLRVSALLKDEAERCVVAQPTDGVCSAYFSAAGHLQVMAVHIVQCSRPEIFDVRLAVSAYLEDLAERPDDAMLPLLPRCSA